jgi:peptide/nickel transport system permease protein
MGRFLLRRLLLMLLTLLAISALVFSLVRLQGDPRFLLMDPLASISEEQWENMGRRLGLDKPLIYQYGVFLGQLATGDLGRSIFQRKPVVKVIRDKLPATLQLGFSGLVFGLVMGIPLGVLSAVKRGTVWDYAGRFFALVGQAVPSFWIGIMLIFFFGVQLGWLPTARKGDLSSFILPSVTIGWFAGAGLLRLVRSSMLDVLDSEFVKLAKAKGVTSNAVIWKHAFRNALIPPLTFGALVIAGLVTGSIVVETVFAWPGIGLLAVSSVYNSDYPLTQGIVLVFTTVYVIMAFVVDVLYALVDPRIRYGE